MTYLIDAIQKHIESLIKENNNLYYYGTLTSLCSKDNNETLIKLTLDNPYNKYLPSGYLTICQGEKAHNLSFSTDYDFLHFNIYSNKIELEPKSAQITKEEPVHPQAITKEDWTAPQKMKIILEGNYTPHRKLIAHAYSIFEKEGKSELWLPSFFNQLTFP